MQSIVCIRPHVAELFSEHLTVAPQNGHQGIRTLHKFEKTDRQKAGKLDPRGPFSRCVKSYNDFLRVHTSIKLCFSGSVNDITDLLQQKFWSNSLQLGSVHTPSSEFWHTSEKMLRNESFDTPDEKLQMGIKISDLFNIHPNIWSQIEAIEYIGDPRYSLVSFGQTPNIFLNQFRRILLSDYIAL